MLLGVSVVLLGWPDGPVRLPLACRGWHQGGAAQYDLALAWRSSARQRLQCTPTFVLFASWSPSQKLLKRLRDYGGLLSASSKSIGALQGVRACALSRTPPGTLSVVALRTAKSL